MADQPTFNLTYASIPFLPDEAITVRLNSNDSALKDRIPEELQQPRKHQTSASLLEELNRKIDFAYLNDFVPPLTYPGRNLGAIAHPQNVAPSPSPIIKAGEFYYPTGAARWSVFRMFATSTLTKNMVSAAYTGGSTAQPLVMSNLPLLPDNPDEVNYSITTPMYMLPPRCLGETGNGLDGLYLITLVDERWFWQWKAVSLWEYLGQNTTWNTLIQAVASALGVTITNSTIEDAYFQPEQDSQLWTNYENGGVLLDALAWNVGRVVVRNLDGTFQLQTNTEAENSAAENRGSAASCIRLAGGDMFNSLTTLPVGDLSTARNAVVPQNVTMTFPQYVIGNDPVPHLVNSRYSNQRPSAWYEQSYGSVYKVETPIASGGHSVSGMQGVGHHYIHTTAKALYSGENQIGSDPLNVSGLTSLAMQVAQSFYESQAQPGLDEVYPGIYAWEPDGYYDILWTWSKNRRMCSTRVMRTEWNQIIREYQHATPPLPNYTNTPPGVGGPSVAQTWRDSYGIFSGTGVGKTLTADLTSGGLTAALSNINYFPTDQRWRGKIENEIVVFEGTSGGVNVGIAVRGADGTKQVLHGAGNTVEWVLPDTTYGVNLATHGKGFFVNQKAWQSGGISEALVQCPLRTVRVLDGSGAIINTILHYSGRVNEYDPSQNSGSQFPNDTLCWVQERNGAFLQSGSYLGGQLGGYGVSGSPVYLVNATSSGSSLSSGLPPVNARDQYNISGSVTPQVTGTILAADTSYSINNAAYLPTENRWVAVIDSEALLLEGTSGGTNSLGIVQRGFLGTTAAGHVSGAAVRWQMPDAVSGVNLTTYDKGFFAFYGEYTSGGNGTIEARLRCPIRTVRPLDGSGVLINGYRHFSGRVVDYNPHTSGDPMSGGGPYVSGDLIWVVERNSQFLQSGWRYDGQLTGFSSSGGVAPIYAVNVFGSSGQSSSTGGADIGAKLAKDTVSVSPQSSGIVPFDVELWDTNSFHTGSEGQCRFSGGGIGKYQVEASCDGQVTFAGTGTVEPRALYLTICTNNGQIVSGGQICALMSRQHYTEPTATGTEATTVEYDEACLHIGTHVNITALSNTLELWVENNTTETATFNRSVMSFQKVNKAGTVLSGG